MNWSSYNTIDINRYFIYDKYDIFVKNAVSSEKREITILTSDGSQIMSPLKFQMNLSLNIFYWAIG